MENLPYIWTMEELEALIAEWGFLPFFQNRVEGFSIFDVMDEDRIFNSTADCAWNWKGPIISHWDCAYGKFFGGKAGYIHLRWLPDFMNWRRSVHPLESYPEEARHILSVLRENESMPSRPLKRASGFTLARRKRLLADPSDPTRLVREKRTGADFDSMIVRLQGGVWVCIADFEPAPGRNPDSGWTLSVYSTPEAMYEIDWRAAVAGRTPQQSRDCILTHLRRLFPEATEKAWASLI